MKFSSVLLSEDSSARPYQMCGQILTFPEKKDLMHNMVTTSNRISCISMHWATTTNQPNQTGKKKFSMAPLNNMHKGHCWWQRLARPLSCLSRQISHLTRVPRLIRPSNTTDGTAKTLLKLIEVITRNHGHFAPVSQWIWTLRGFGPPPPQSISAGGYGPPTQVWIPPTKTFLLSIVYIVFGN